ncbi:hypothetical protein BpHYR1_038275, partial [Brachionus plicatilis]
NTDAIKCYYIENQDEFKNHPLVNFKLPVYVNGLGVGMENKGINIKSFDGNGDPKEFKENFSLTAVMVGLDSVKSILPMLLTGKAERLYEGMENGSKTNIETIFDTLINGCSQSADSL